MTLDPVIDELPSTSDMYFARANATRQHGTWDAPLSTSCIGLTVTRASLINRMEKFLAEKGLERKDFGTDGHSLFSCFAAASGSSKDDIRRIALENTREIVNRCEVMKRRHNATAEEVNTVCQRLEKGLDLGGEECPRLSWGDPLTLEVIAHTLDYCVKVFTLDATGVGSYVVNHGGEMQITILHSHFLHYELLVAKAPEEGTHVVGSRNQSDETGLGDNISSRVWDPRDMSCLDEGWDERRGEELLEGEVVHHAMSADEVQKASGCSWF